MTQVTNFHLFTLNTQLYTTTKMSSFAKLASAPGLGANYSFYALPVGWLVSYVQLDAFWGF